MCVILEKARVCFCRVKSSEGKRNGEDEVGEVDGHIEDEVGGLFEGE